MAFHVELAVNDQPSMLALWRPHTILKTKIELGGPREKNRLALTPT